MATIIGAYRNIKKQFSDFDVLFYKIGDFYEAFDESARIVAEVCDVMQTTRRFGLDQERVRNAGIPYHAISGMVTRLTEKGHRVMLAEPKGE